MSSTPQPDTLPLTRLLSRPVLLSGGATALAALLAWLWLTTQAADMAVMPGMAMTPAPWSPGHVAAGFVMWALMMVAMMLPSAAPMILLHARLDRGTRAERARDHALFVGCYLAVWGGFSALASGVQTALVATGAVSSMSLALGDRYAATGLLLLAAGWQLTAAKGACLDNCRSPIGFIMRYWRPGPAGALRLGLRHGLYCLGCCWSLMLLLFVGGVMNLAWVALLATLVFAEKLAPPGWRLERWLAAALAIGAVMLLIA